MALPNLINKKLLDRPLEVDYTAENLIQDPEDNLVAAQMT
jgi:hypothetical protein